MKSTLLFATASVALSSFVCGQAQDEYVNWIRQIQTETNAAGALVENVMDIYVESEGSDQSALGIPTGGSLFQLWTMDTTSQTTWLLDTATVGANRPEAEITITTLDSYAGVPRTRADIPFTVSTSFFNLQEPGEGVDSELTQVRHLHYLEDAGSTDGQFPVIADQVVTENGIISQTDIYTSLLPPESEPAYKAEGVEHFAVQMISDRMEENTIATAKVEVFPFTTGSLGNFEDGNTFRSLPEFVTLKVNDPYPGSEVFLKVKVVTPATTAGGEETVVTHTMMHRNIDRVDNEDIDVQFDEFGALNLKHGDKVTFSLVAESIFDTIILDEEEKTFLSNLDIRANINSL